MSRSYHESEVSPVLGECRAQEGAGPDDSRASCLVSSLAAVAGASCRHALLW